MTRSTRFLRLAFLAVVLLGTGRSQVCAQSQTIFNFNGNLNVSTSVGTAAGLSFFNATTTTFNSTSAFGIGNLPGNPAGTRTVMNIPAFPDSTTGFALAPNVGANGGSATKINQYTVGFDIYYPSASFAGNFAPLFQTNTNNTDDGDLFIRKNTPVTPEFGIGQTGYTGASTVPFDQWVRIVAVYDLGNATNAARYYANGSKLLTWNPGASQLDARFAVEGTTGANRAFILSDEDGETAVGYISSFYFSDTSLSDAQIAGFGVASAGGFQPVPEPMTILAISTTGLGLIGLVRRLQNKAK